MKKISTTFLFFLTFCSVIQLSAQVVTEKTARQAAFSILSTKNAIMPATAAELILISVPGTSVVNPEIFIYNNPNGGFAIISGDKSATPVIGYSTRNSVPQTAWKSNFAWWIQNAIEQIQYYRQHATKSTSEIDEEWGFLLSGNTTNNPFHSSKAVLPFLRSTWGQDGVFNDQCPEDANGEALVGCVATAMAQVIYYYQFPQTGYGSHSYNAYGYGTQSVNFGASTYNYSEMSGDPGFPMPEVAELSYHCGVAVDMGYGYDGSGAYTWDVPDALTTYFRYESANYRSRMTYNSTTWATMMRNNLDLLRPVIYSGSGDGGGHAFVMDGYEGTDFFHFDWGWDGYANDYFYLNALNPAGSDFNDSHQCVESIYPPSASYPYGCTGTKTLTSTFGLIEDGSGPTENYEANCNCSWLISPGPQCDYFKITFEELDLATDDSVKIYAGADATATVAGAFSGSTVPAYFNVNSSQVFIQFVSNSTNHSKGFLLNYVGHIPLGCSGITSMTNPTDTFDDGSGTNTYGNSSFCRWNIQPAGATSISVHFIDFDMADEFDLVKVTDAITSTVLGEFHKGDNPTIVSAATSKIQVLFQSNTSITGDGFKVFYTTTTDISERPEGYSLLVFPNPASNVLNIIPGNLADGASVVIYDFSGRCVFNQKTDGSTMMIPIDNLSSGLYSVGLISENGNIWQKVVIE
ncbi:MAG TPA: C10 family peptidase [Bacteroidales bacterium]|nr:C10 family peptidase [Bacteroidales bacterium]